MTDIRVIRYRTRPECAADNADLIGAVFDELSERTVVGMRYTALRLDDGVTFVHIATFDGDDNPLDSSPAFAAFQADIGARLDEGPFPATATVVGSYGGVIGA